MVKEYLVEVESCDDSTDIIIQANDAKFAIIKELADKITKASAYGCQPRMSIREIVEADKGLAVDE